MFIHKMKSRVYFYYTRPRPMNQKWDYECLPGWIFDGEGRSIVNKKLDLNDPDLYLDDALFIGPKETESEMLEYLNKKFNDLLDNNMILRFTSNIYDSDE